MDGSLVKYFIICLVGLCVQSTEAGPRMRTGWQRRDPWTHGLHPPSATGDPGRPASGVSEHGQEHRTDAGETQAGDMVEHVEGFTRRKHMKRGLEVHFGQFNSDMHGCGGIQTRNCSSRSNCSGCLGMYTCNRTLGKCRLKGLSLQTDKFRQSLRGF